MYRFLIFCSLLTVTISARADFKIKIVDQFFLPVPQALILIGTEQDDPFKDNLFLADSFGEIHTPETWVQATPITVDARGFVRQTLLGQSPSDMLIQLHPLENNPQLYVSGTITDLPVVNKDKLVDFSVVLTTFSQNDFIHINQNQFISPYADNMSLLGKVAPVFSNVSLPEQKENYGLPLTLSKPIYTTFFPTTGEKKLVSMSGQFPFKQVADSLKNDKTFFDVINDFEIHSLGRLDLQFIQNTSGVDFSGAMLFLNDKALIKAPAIQNQEQALILPMNPVGNYFLPSGIKKLNSSETAQFNTLNSSSLRILIMIKKTDDFKVANDQIRVSALFLEPLDQNSSIYLPLIEDPVPVSTYPISFKTAPFSAPQGLYPSGTMMVLSTVNETVYNKQIVKINQPQWEIYSLNWEHQVQLPKWPLDVTSPSSVTQTFEITYFAQGQPLQDFNLKNRLDQATHLTKSAVQLQY